jgi:hypothetical protein
LSVRPIRALDVGQIVGIFALGSDRRIGDRDVRKLDAREAVDLQLGLDGAQADDAVHHRAAEVEAVLQLRIGGIGLLIGAEILGRVVGRNACRHAEEAAQRRQIVANAVAGDRGIEDVGLRGVVLEARQAGLDNRAREARSSECRAFVVDVEIAEIAAGLAVGVAHADLQALQEAMSIS